MKRWGLKKDAMVWLSQTSSIVVWVIAQYSAGEKASL